MSCDGVVTHSLPSGVPTLHQLRAALVVAGHLRFEPTPVAQLRNGYPHVASDGVFSPPDLRTGEELLVAAGWAVFEGGSIRLAGESQDSDGDELLAARLLLRSYLREHPPQWVGLVSRDGDLNLDLVPADALESLSGAIPDPDEREAVLLELGTRFDDAYRRELGREGELAVVRGCREILLKHDRSDLARQVLQVSAITDAVGYDVKSPSVVGDVRRLEVKTTRQHESGVYRVFISRNEAEVGRKDASWRLVICVGRVGSEIEIVGWCDGRSVVSLLPQDSMQAKWMSSELTLTADQLIQGLPLYEGE